MDLLSHALLGGALGQLVLGQKKGKKAIVYGALAGLLPDLDVLGVFFLDDATQLQFHRGITHSIILTLVISVFLGWFLSRKDKSNRNFWILLFLAGIGSHLLLDVATCYGTGLLEPFSKQRFSLNSIFVADIFYTIPLLICMIFVWLVKNEKNRKVWNLTGLFISSLYFIFTIGNHFYVSNIMFDSFTEQELKANDFTVTPTPLNNFLWMAYSKDSSGAWIGYYSIFDKTKQINFERIERNDSLLIPYQNNEYLKNLIHFSQGNYIASKKEGIIYFSDLRFGHRSNWDEKNAPFAFNFSLAPDADNKYALSRIQFDRSAYKTFHSLLSRICGNKIDYKNE